ncbi:hypothetical protein Glove_69g27 [Diversispora epigaea]|uniref:Uncharacterized protein n=1 Tax=Diversispora epigaea TaxID=1348612 RepID=A0A397JA67_9GLOM|nr:hypothetical protein Glove_69g27 [Diversispora epigaea]
MVKAVIQLTSGKRLTVPISSLKFETKSSSYKYQRKNNNNIFIVDMSDQKYDKVVALLQRYFNNSNNNVAVNLLINVCVHFSSTGTGEQIAADVSICFNINYVQSPNIPYPGPPLGDKNNMPHVRIVCEVGNHQSTENWTSKCQLWMNQVYRGTNIPTACNAPGLPLFQIDIPVAQVFWDPPIPAVAKYAPRVPLPLANVLLILVLICIQFSNWF